MLNKCNDIPKLICMYCCCSARTTVVNARLTKQVRNSEAVARRRMNEVDEHGWAHIHQAARKGDPYNRAKNFLPPLKPVLLNSEIACLVQVFKPKYIFQFMFRFFASLINYVTSKIMGQAILAGAGIGSSCISVC